MNLIYYASSLFSSCTCGAGFNNPHIFRWPFLVIVYGQWVMSDILKLAMTKMFVRGSHTYIIYPCQPHAGSGQCKEVSESDPHCLPQGNHHLRHRDQWPRRGRLHLQVKPKSHNLCSFMIMWKSQCGANWKTSLKNSKTFWKKLCFCCIYVLKNTVKQ